MIEKTLLRTLRGEVVSPPPIWLMRQAGRYLPEYKETRKRAGSFLDLCYTPELAEEVTLQPIRRYDFDAAILFADILLVPQAMGLDLWFVEGEGPRLSPVTDRAGLEALSDVNGLDETLAPVYETIRRLRKSLPPEKTLIGFAGAPWTVATYMVAGRGTPDQAPARRWMYRDPAGFSELIDRITDATVHYLSRQIEAGAEAVKLFDSWAGSLPPAAFDRYAIIPMTKITGRLKQQYPDVPVIGFPRGAGIGYLSYAAETAVDCMAVDSMTSMRNLRRSLGKPLTLQGNLDPMLLTLDGPAMGDSVHELLREMSGAPHVFNLGHGITPDASPDQVGRLVDLVRSWRP